MSTTPTMRTPITVPRQPQPTVEQPYGYIYITTNLVDGKQYLGQHSKFEFDPNYIGSGKALKRAIRKYGKQNFKCEPIEWAATKEELDQREIWWIDFLGCVESEDWYNLSVGGEGYPGGELHPLYKRKMPEYQRQRIIETSPHISGEKHPMYGKGYKFVGKGNPMYGKSRELSPTYGRKHTKSECKKMSQNHCDSSGANNSQAKPIVQLSVDGELIRRYGYLGEPCKMFKVFSSEESIRKCCKGRQLYYMGYRWMYEKDYIEQQERSE